MATASVHAEALSPEYSFRRNTLLIVLGCITASSLVSLLLTPLFGFGAQDVGGLAIIILKSVGLLAWLWRRPQDFQVVGLLELGFEVVGGIGKFASTLLIDGMAWGLGGYSHWLPLVYLVAVLVLPSRVALVVCLGVYATLLGLGVAYALSPSVPAQAKTTFGNSLVQMYLMHGAFIAFLALLGRLRQAYSVAARQAELHQRLANVDALTGLANRRQLMEWLNAARRDARGEPLSILLFDLDHFKRVNDTFGHDVGDEVLCATAGAARGALRDRDLLGRWGGEEFLVILPNCTLTQAQAVASRLRDAVASVLHPVAGAVTVSCGGAQHQPDENVQTLLRRADEALYAAKNEGRNVVRVRA